MKKTLLTLLALLFADLAPAQSAPIPVKPTATDKLQQIQLPTVPKPVGNYQLYQISGNLIYISQIALDGLTIKGPGIIKDESDIPRGQQAARQTALNILAVVKQAVGDLNQIEKVVRLDGYIASAAGFTQQAQVMNGASDVFVEVLGERGVHARSAVGSLVLPLNSPIEISAIIELKRTAPGVKS